MKAYLVQVDARTIAGNSLILRFASHDDAALCHFGGQVWWPAIARLPSIGYDFFDGGFRADIISPSGTLFLSMAAVPGMAAAIWSDAAIIITQMELANGQVSGAVTLFAGRIGTQPSFENGTAQVSFEADSSWLDEPLLELYTGTGAIEGPDELEGAVKQLLLGNPRFVGAVLIDAVNNVYQLSAYGAIVAVDVAYDRLSSLGASSGNFATLAALIAANIPNGSWATCLALGLVRHGAPPDGQVSYHVQGDTGGAFGHARLPGAIIRRIAELKGGTVSVASLIALNISRPWPLSLAVSEQTTARDLIQAIAASVKAVAGINWTGELFVEPVGIGAPSLTLKSDGSALPPVASVTQLPVDPPFWRLATLSERTWLVHGDADIAYQFNFRGEYSAARVYRLDDVVSIADGSTWRFIGATPLAGETPSDANANWERRSAATVVDFANVTGTGDLLNDVSDALALAAARGRIWTTTATPSLAESNIGDTWVAATGIFYDRIDAQLTLNGNTLTLNGNRLSLYWTRASVQPLEATIATADAASAAADDAIDGLAGLADDGILSKNEKITKLIPNSAELESKYQALVLAAASLSVSTVALTADRTAWVNHLNSLSPAWDNKTQDTPVVRATFDSLRDAYDAEIAETDRAIKAAVKALGDAAQAAADAAQAAADAASAAAALANNRIAEISSDNVLSPVEKSQVISDYEALVVERAGILAEADAYGIITERTNYNNSVTALIAYMETLTTPVFWSDVSGDTDIVGTVFRVNFLDVRTKKRLLLNQFKIIDGDGNVGSGKVIKNSLANDIILQKKAASGTAIDSTNTGAVLAIVANLDVKQSQGGFASFEVDLFISGEPIDSIDSRAVMYVAIERKPSASGSYAFIEDGLLVYSNHAITVPPDPATGILVGFAVAHLMRGSYGFRYVDTPPSDGEYDYRFTARKAPNGQVVSGSAVSATASNVYINARSEKVAS